MLPALLGALTLFFLFAFINALRTGQSAPYSSINPTRREQPIMYWFFTIMWAILSGLCAFTAMGAFLDQA